jgi:hypothetical protein
MCCEKADVRKGSDPAFLARRRKQCELGFCARNTDLDPALGAEWLVGQAIANATGLSKSAVQIGMRRLLRRDLVRIHRDSATAIPEYRIVRPWLKR